MLKYDFPDHYRGDFWEGLPQITLTKDTSAVNLSGATIRMQFRARPDAEPAWELSTTNGGITITNELSGSITVNGQVLDITPQTYYYDLQYLIPAIAPTYIKTVLAGTLKVVHDITY